MAFALNTRTGRGRYRPLAEINVTPLVDVMLVLADHLHGHRAADDLRRFGGPAEANAQQINSDSQPLTVSINAGGDIFLQNQQVDLPELVAKLQAIAQNNPDRRIFVRGDKDLAYGRIMQVMGTITRAASPRLRCWRSRPAGRHRPRRRHRPRPTLARNQRLRLAPPPRQRPRPPR